MNEVLILSVGVLAVRIGTLGFRNPPSVSSRDRQPDFEVFMSDTPTQDGPSLPSNLELPILQSGTRSSSVLAFPINVGQKRLSSCR